MLPEPVLLRQVLRGPVLLRPGLPVPGPALPVLLRPLAAA